LSETRFIDQHFYRLPLIVWVYVCSFSRNYLCMSAGTKTDFDMK